MGWYLGHMGNITEACRQVCQTAGRLKDRGHLQKHVINGREVLK